MMKTINEVNKLFNLNRYVLLEENKLAYDNRYLDYIRNTIEYKNIGSNIQELANILIRIFKYHFPIEYQEYCMKNFQGLYKECE